MSKLTLTPELVKELAEAAGTKITSRTKFTQEFLEDLISSVGEASDDKWEALSEEAQNTYNECCDLLQEGDPLPEVEDKKETKGRGASGKDDKPKRGRGRGRKEEVDEGNESDLEEIDFADVDEDMVVTVICGDEESTGTVTKKTARQLTVKVGRKSHTFKKADIDEILAPASESEESEEASTEIAYEPISDIKELNEDDEVKVVLGDDEFEGKIVELSKKGRKVTGFVIAVDGEEETILAEDVLFDDGDSIEVKKEVDAKPKRGRKPASDDKKADKEATRTRGRASKPAGSKAKSGRATNATAKTRQMICENLDSSKNDIGTMLADEGVEIKQATLDIVYSDTHKTIECLRNVGELK